MAIKNFSFTLSALSALLTLSACQSPARRSAPVRTTEHQVEQLPPGAPPEQPPPPAPQERKRIAVILGPGGAKALAHVGVLKAFQQQRIPIEKIVGLEWGALIAGMYAAKGQINDVEWKLYKMEQKNLPRAKGFFAKRLGEDSVKIMDDYFEDSFQKEDVAGMKIPFSCPSRSVWTGVVAWQTRGALKDVMKHCLPFPPLFKAQGTFLAGASQAIEAVELLRNEGYNVIILVNVLGSGLPVGQDSLLDNLNYVILWQEVKRAMNDAAKFNVEVVNVDTSAYPMVQFESKKELIGLGEAAGQAAASALISKYSF